MRCKLQKIFVLTFFSAAIVLLPTPKDQAIAAKLQLTWTDNSTDELGFNIERKQSTGSFALIATVGANVTSYKDSSLLDNTTYCYRVNAFNDAGASPYTPEACATTPAVYSLALAVQGNGTVTSSPSGIDCGATCTASFTDGTTVALKAVAATGYTFSGWSGDGDCLDGSLTMNGNKSCTATFTADPPASSYTLAVNAVGVVSPAGSGSGKIVSSPAGIDCGSNCSATFAAGTMVALQAMPDAGSTFDGWSGDADCLDGSVTMDGNKSCSGSFKIISYTLAASHSGNGKGKVVSDIAGLDCGSSCVAEYAVGTVVGLKAMPSPGSVFAGWSGDADCMDGSVTANANKTCAAVFEQGAGTNIGIFRPSTGAWYLMTGGGVWEKGPLGGTGYLPVLGDWNGSGISQLGAYDSSRKKWQLDTNDNGIWDNCGKDTCYDFMVARNTKNDETPLIGSWDGGAKDSVGVFRFIANDGAPEGYWYFDRNGNGKFDGCNTDLCLGPFGTTGDIPVVGDWDGTGIAKIGVFTPETGMWTLDYNGNGNFDGCDIDRCFGPFGHQGDIPVVGDWDGTGIAKIGIFRAESGEWYLDKNGNGQWDGCDVDQCVAGFGQAGDLPVMGKW